MDTFIVALNKLLLPFHLLLFLVGPVLAADYSIHYTYDDMGYLIGVEYVDRGSITYTYDKAGDLLNLVIARTSGDPGDIDGDDQVTLNDALLGLQLMAGRQPFLAVTTIADASGDNRIGMEEILYILQELAE